MPDLAVEIMSPSNTMRRIREKAQIYLTNGTTIVWIVLPAETSVEVCRLTQAGEIKREVFGPDNTLTAADVLPGFALAPRQIFE